MRRCNNTSRSTHYCTARSAQVSLAQLLPLRGAHQSALLWAGCRWSRTWASCTRCWRTWLCCTVQRPQAILLFTLCLASVQVVMM